MISYITPLFNLVNDFNDGKLVKHELVISGKDNIVNTLNKLYYDLPSITVHITNKDGVSYLINEYGLIDDLCIVLSEHSTIKFNLQKLLFNYDDGVNINTIYDNRKLNNLVRSNNFTQSEIDSLRDCHNQLHKYTIPVIEIHSTTLDEYLKWR